MFFSLPLFLFFPLKQNEWLVIATVTKNNSMISSLQGWLTADNATKCRLMDSCLLKKSLCTHMGLMYVPADMHNCMGVHAYVFAGANTQMYPHRRRPELEVTCLTEALWLNLESQISANLAGKFALGRPCLCLLSSEVIDSWYACLTFARVLGIWTIHGAFLSVLRKLSEETFFQGPCHSGYKSNYIRF